MSADRGAVPADVRLARAWLSRAVEPGSMAMWQFVSEAGPVAKELASAHAKVSATYTIAYIAHAPLEPRARTGWRCSGPP